MFLAEGSLSAPLALLLCNHLLSDGTKRALLTCVLFGFALHRRVDGSSQKFLGLVAAQSRVLKRNHRVNTESQRFLLAREPISEPPKLAARRLDEDVEPAPSDSFLGLADGLALRTVTSLRDMLVSPFLRGSDTNKNTNNFTGYQQTRTHWAKDAGSKSSALSRLYERWRTAAKN
jgi:hypothetical protein